MILPTESLSKSHNVSQSLPESSPKLVEILHNSRVNNMRPSSWVIPQDAMPVGASVSAGSLCPCTPDHVLLTPFSAGRSLGAVGELSHIRDLNLPKLALLPINGLFGDAMLPCRVFVGCRLRFPQNSDNLFRHKSFLFHLGPP